MLNTPSGEWPHDALFYGIRDQFGNQDLVDYIFSDPLVECTIPDVETEESDAASSEKDESRESTEEKLRCQDVIHLRPYGLF